MILTLEELNQIEALSDYTASQKKQLEKAIEQRIRSYTHNNFMRYDMRSEGRSIGRRVFVKNRYFAEGDTVEITGSPNAGLYTIETVADDCIKLDRDLYAEDYNRVTKVIYPEDVKAGVISLLEYQTENKDKIGIKSETISRHSVTYFDNDKSNTVAGFPAALMAFLEPYIKMQF